MQFTQNDLNEMPQVAKLLSKIDNIDSNYAETIADEIFQKQPFFLTVFLGYHHDTTPIELEEIMKIYFLIWEYFRTNEKVQRIKVTEEYYERIEDKNIAMLQYTDGVPDKMEKIKIYSSDLSNLKSKALYAAVVKRYNEREVLLKMDTRKRGIILLGIKCFIECFDTI